MPFVFLLIAYILMPLPFLVLQFYEVGLWFNLLSILSVAATVLSVFFSWRRKRYQWFTLPPAGFAIFLIATLIVWHGF